MVASRQRYQFTADAYHRALRADVFRNPDTVHFADGAMYDAPPTGEMPRSHHFTADEYQHMGALGILTTSDRVELLEGEIVGKPVHGPRHVRCHRTTNPPPGRDCASGLLHARPVCDTTYR